MKAEGRPFEKRKGMEGGGEGGIVWVMGGKYLMHIHANVIMKPTI
jgi:hypothetical protein